MLRLATQILDRARNDTSHADGGDEYGDYDGHGGGDGDNGNDRRPWGLDNAANVEVSGRTCASEY